MRKKTAVGDIVVGFKNLKRIEPEEFYEGMNIATAAYVSTVAAIRQPSKVSLQLENPDGSVDEIRFNDIPLNQMGFAIYQHYKNDLMKARSILGRILALQALMGEAEMKQWVQEDEARPGYIGINEAVLDVAATMKVNAEGGFEKECFFRKVAKRAAEKERGMD